MIRLLREKKKNKERECDSNINDKSAVGLSVVYPRLLFSFMTLSVLILCEWSATVCVNLKGICSSFLNSEFATCWLLKYSNPDYFYSSYIKSQVLAINSPGLSN